MGIYHTAVSSVYNEYNKKVIFTDNLPNEISGEKGTKQKTNGLVDITFGVKDITCFPCECLTLQLGQGEGNAFRMEAEIWSGSELWSYICIFL